jgi:hypothetical protein
MSYTPPIGGTRAPTPKPGPKHIRIPMVAWRQPLGGVRSSVPPRPGT